MSDLAEKIGPVAAQEFENAPEYAKATLLAWIEKLSTLTDDEFIEVAQHAIYESALCSRFRGNFDHEHCKASAAFHESSRRHVAAGHHEDCRGASLYSRAHAAVMRSHGYKPTPDGKCTCSSGEAGE